MSLLVIGTVAAVIAGATTAYFSDTESATGTLSAGTIDIRVDGQNPWQGTFQMADLKPSETGLINFTIRNLSANPVVVWKHIGNVQTSGGEHPESEFAEDPNDTINHIHTVTNYDLKVDSTVIFADEDGLSVNDIRSMWMPLGTIPPGGTLDVEQSYHMRGEDTGNWAQGDVMTFDIDLYAEQELGTGPGQLSRKLFLDDKTGEPDWHFIANGTWGLLKWDAAGNYSFAAQGLTPGTGYTLIHYPEPQTTWPWPVNAIASGTSDAGGKLSLSGTLPAVSSGKIWLVLTNDIVGVSLSGWTPAQYLFESHLVNIP